MTTDANPTRPTKKQNEKMGFKSKWEKPQRDVPINKFYDPDHEWDQHDYFEDNRDKGREWVEEQRGELGNRAGSRVIANIQPGQGAGSTAALIEAGVDPTTEEGQYLINMDNARRSQEQAAKERLSEMSADDASAWAKTGVKVGFSALMSSKQIVDNYIQIGLGQGPGALFTLDALGDATGGSDLGKFAMGWFGGGDELKYTDTGAGWFIDEDSPFAKYGVLQGQERLDSNPDFVVEMDPETGKPLQGAENLRPEFQRKQVLEVGPQGELQQGWEIKSIAPSTIGQWVAANPGRQEIGSTSYHAVSGITDFVWAFGDPSFYVGVGAVRATARSGGNMLLRWQGKAEKYASKKNVDALRQNGDLASADDFALAAGVIASIRQSPEIWGDTAGELADHATQALETVANTAKGTLENQRALDEVTEMLAGAQSMANKKYDDILAQQDELSKQLADAPQTKAGKPDGRTGEVKRINTEIQKLWDDHDGISDVLNVNKARTAGDQKALKSAEAMLKLQSDDLLAGFKKTANNPMEQVENTWGLLSSHRKVNTDRALSYLMKSKNRQAEGVLKMISQMDHAGEIFDASRGKFGGVLSKQLANAGTSEQVQRILAKAIAEGDLNQNIGKLRGLRASYVARFGGKATAENMGLRYMHIWEPVYTKMAPAIKGGTLYGHNLFHSAVPWATMRNATDADGMVDLISDSTLYNMRKNRPMRNVKGWKNDIDDVEADDVAAAMTAKELDLIKHVDNKGNFTSDQMAGRIKQWQLENGIDAKPTAAMIDGWANEIVQEWTNAKGWTDNGFRHLWMQKMMDAPSEMARRRVWKEYLEAQLNRTANFLKDVDEDISLDDFVQMRKTFLKTQNEGEYTKAVNAELRAAVKEGDEIVVPGIGKVNFDNLGVVSAHLANQIVSPDWSRLRRVTKSTKTLKREIARMKKLEEKKKGGGAISYKGFDGYFGQPGSRRDKGADFAQFAADEIFTTYWRASVLAFRNAYILRNMIDIQVRMFLKGHPSLITGLPGVLAVAAYKVAKPDQKFSEMNGSIGRRMFKQVSRAADSGHRARARRDIYGEDKVATARMEDQWLGDVDGVGQLVRDRNFSHFDPGTGAVNSGRVNSSTDFEELFLVKGADDTWLPQRRNGRDSDGDITTNADDFFDGLTWDVIGARTSTLPNVVLDGLTDDILNEAGKRARTEELFGGSAWRHIIEGNAENKAILDSPTMSDQQKLDMFHQFLWDEGETWSYASMWKRRTVNFDDGVVRSLKDMPKTGAGKKEVDTWKKELHENIKKGWEKANLFKDGRFVNIEEGGALTYSKGAQRPLPPSTTKAGDLLHKVDPFISWFFRQAGSYETSAGYLPEYQFSYWDAAADSVGALGRTDAERLLEAAGEELGKAVPGSWAWQTHKRLKSNAKRALKREYSDFTYDDLDMVANKWAGHEVERLFYNAMNRNQMAHALRLISPFIQPFLNSVKVWGEEASKNFNQVVRANQAITGAQGPGSAAALPLYDDDPTNPEDSIIYRDQSTGAMTVAIPALNNAIAFLANTSADVRSFGREFSLAPNVSPEALSSAIPLQNMNVLFQNGISPGVGPIVSIPAQVLEPWWRNSPIPDVIMNELSGYEKYEEDKWSDKFTNVMPSWATKLAAWFTGQGSGHAKTRKYLQPAIAHLIARDLSEYGGVDAEGNMQPLQEADKKRLLEDAEKLASGLLFAQAIGQNILPGSPVVDPQIPITPDNVGESIKAESWRTIGKFYTDALKYSGNKQTAIGDTAEKYGNYALMALLPYRNSASEYRPSNAGWQFFRSNPEMANEYPDGYSYFFPQGGVSQRLAAIEAQNNEWAARDNDSLIGEVNQILWMAEDESNRRLFADNKITFEEYEETKSDLDKKRRTTTSTTSSSRGNDEKFFQYWKMANDPKIMEAAPEVSEAIRTYLENRRAALNAVGNVEIGTKAHASNRAKLSHLGNVLVSQVPEFRPIWVDEFLPELNATPTETVSKD